MTVLLGETKMIPIKDLVLDPQNPRIPDIKKGAIPIFGVSFWMLRSGKLLQVHQN